jgi:ubiquinone/menaquinone biosynthesis C-methylase UbiE
VPILKSQPRASSTTSFDDAQKAVDERFNSETAFWSEANKRTDVLGEIYRGRQRILLELVDELDLPANARVLEVGCGVGFLSVILAQRGFVVTATDNASAMAESAKMRVGRARMESRVQVTVQDVHNLTIPSNSIDLVAGLGVVVWLHDLRRALAELCRVLKPGGNLIVSVDNISSVRMRSMLDFPVIFRGVARRTLEKAHLLLPKPAERTAEAHFYSAREFEMHLRQAGFEELRYVGFGFGPFTWWGRELPPRLGVSVHSKLQKYSDRRVPFLKRVSSQLLFLATKR